jgi:hypothetical protein
MRFFPNFPWGASSPRSERRLGSHDRIGAQSGLQSDGPLAHVFSTRTIPSVPIAHSIQSRKNLTEFRFEHSLFQLGLERL